MGAAREREERARHDAEEGARWSAFLAEVERILGESLDYRTVLDSLVHAAVPTIADLCGVSELHEDGKIYTVAVAVSDRAREAELLEHLRSHGMDAERDRGLPRVFRTGEAKLAPEITDDVLRDNTADEAHFQAARALGMRSGMLIPLRSRSKILGVIWFATTTSGRHYDETDFERARDLVSRAAFAADNALLYQEMERGERRSRFLAEAGEVLSASLVDYEATLQSVADLAVPLLADRCYIDLVEDHTVRRVAVAFRDPANSSLVEATRRFAPVIGRGLAGEVIASGEAVRFTEITPEIQQQMATSAEHLALIRTLGAHSLMIVPLIARGRTLGVVHFYASVERPPYTADDQALAEELARRAALAVDNARLYQQSQAANRAKSDFLAVISHELRTPLNAIIGYTDLLSAGIAGPLTDEQGKHLGRVEASARHLLQLIEEVLTYSRMETGREELQLRPTDVSELLRALATVTAAQAAAKGLAFHLDLPDTPLTLRTDPAKLRQIMANLLSNAVKFTERGEVTLSARLEEDALRIRVRDTGIGIAPEQFGKLFEPFWQAEPATTRRAGGTGLGLPVSQRLSRLLGGDLTVESVRGRGSTFTLNLPLTPPSPNGPAPPPR